MFGGVSAWMGDRQGLTSRDFYRRFALKLSISLFKGQKSKSVAGKYVYMSYLPI